MKVRVKFRKGDDTKVVNVDFPECDPDYELNQEEMNDAIDKAYEKVHGTEWGDSTFVNYWTESWEKKYER